VVHPKIILAQSRAKSQTRNTALSTIDAQAITPQYRQNAP
jgi:hypothetical protein